MHLFGSYLFAANDLFDRPSGDRSRISLDGVVGKEDVTYDYPTYIIRIRKCHLVHTRNGEIPLLYRYYQLDPDE